MSSKVYVGNLSWGSNEESLRAVFSTIGEVVDAIVMRDRETHRSRGFGFVTFTNETDAATAVEQLNEQEIDGRRVRVQPESRSARPQGQGRGFGGY